MLRRLRRRFGISAPKMAVRTHVAWYWRALIIVAVLSISFVLAGWIYDTGGRITGFDRHETEEELSRLRDLTTDLEKEAAGLRAMANSAESTLQIERAAQQQLIRQIKGLEEENARLKEDMAFFENLATAEGKEVGVSLSRLRVEPDSVPRQYRYRVLAAAQGGKKERGEFTGSVQLLVSLRQNGNSAMMVLPGANDLNRNNFVISFKHFMRINGTFQVPDGARVASVEVRLIQDGSMRATQTVTL